MSATETQLTDSAHDAEDHSHAHPSDLTYIKIALILGLITALEVFTYFKSVLDWGRVLMPALLIMMAVKFWLIGFYFMHLKFDSKLLRRLFATGIVLAGAVYIITLVSFKLFSDGVPS